MLWTVGLSLLLPYKARWITEKANPKESMLSLCYMTSTWLSALTGVVFHSRLYWASLMREWHALRIWECRSGTQAFSFYLLAVALRGKKGKKSINACSWTFSFSRHIHLYISQWVYVFRTWIWNVKTRNIFGHLCCAFVSLVVCISWWGGGIH